MRIRKSLSESQAQFGQRFERSASAISLYEKGRLPDDIVLTKLSEMGFSIDWLLTGQGDMKRDGQRPAYPRAQDFSIIRDSDLPPNEKERKLLILIKEIVSDFLNSG